MTLSARYVRRFRDPAKPRTCNLCGRRIDGGDALRLYGAAFSDETPYAVYLHAGCAPEWCDTSREPKILAALERRETPRA